MYDTRTLRDRWRADLAAPALTGAHHVADQALRTTGNTTEANHAAATHGAATEMSCTREHRMQEIGCYVVQEDGTVWAMYAACEHGVREAAAVYVPNFKQNEPPTGETVAAAEGHSK
jgi:hypothetical protein